jgi:hypothetical protein
VQFDHEFDLGRLAPKREKTNQVTMLTPWYVEQIDRRRAG